jgi:catechol 2,3-dioxygenase-like lactoylglutathione lyase family enzyme
MQQRLSLVTLAVGDLARARRFYEEGLGWTPGFAMDDIAFYQLPTMILGLWSRRAMAADLGVAPEALGTGAIQLAHNVPERASVDAILARAVRAGARVLKPAHEAEWGGYTGLFADPDGHPWEVAWNPAWTLASDGTVRLG